MHIIDTIEVMLWKARVKTALENEIHEREFFEEEQSLKQESMRLKIKVPDILTRPPEGR